MSKKLCELVKNAENFDEAVSVVQEYEEFMNLNPTFEAIVEKIRKMRNAGDIKKFAEDVISFIATYEHKYDVPDTVDFVSVLTDVASKESLEEIRSAAEAFSVKEKQDDKGGSVETVNMLNQEIAACGDYGVKGKITEADIDKIVTNNASLDGIKPPLKFGHSETQPLTDGMPAVGWVANLRREGRKMLADFMEVPKLVADLIRAGAYRRVSPEIYTNFVSEGKEVGRVLKAVAILGADIPEMKTLKDLQVMYNSEDTDLIFFAEQTDQGGDDMDKEKFERLQADMAKLQAENISMKVDKFIEDNKEKIPPVVKNLVREILVTVMTNSAEAIKFSEDGKDVEFATVGEAVMGIFQRMPKVVDFSQKTGHKDDDVSDDDKEYKAVVKYAADNKCSIEEAWEAIRSQKASA